MKRVLTILLACLIGLGLSACGDSNHRSGDMPLEIVVREIYYTDEGTIEHRNLQSYAVSTGDRIDVGGLSKLKITITHADTQSITFKTSACFMQDETGETGKVFTVLSGETIVISEPGICDAASLYEFIIPEEY